MTVNAPAARTRMTEAVFAEMMAKPQEGVSVRRPRKGNVTLGEVWLEHGIPRCHWEVTEVGAASSGSPRLVPGGQRA